MALAETETVGRVTPSSPYHPPLHNRNHLQGFYIVTYGLGIYNLNLLIGFLTPRNDMDADGPQLPTRTDQEFRPFIRILPEFKFW